MLKWLLILDYSFGLDISTIYNTTLTNITSFSHSLSPFDIFLPPIIAPYELANPFSPNQSSQTPYAPVAL